MTLGTSGDRTSFDISIEQIRSCLSRKVEVQAFGVCYVGWLKEIRLPEGKILLADEEDTVWIELERIQGFHCLESGC